MVNKLYIKLVALLLLAGLLFMPTSAAFATSVDRMSLGNLEGYPGKTIESQITLEGTDVEERSGYWETFYNKVEGDNERMDITSWITIEPKEYIITQGKSIVCTVKIKIPGNAEPGLWGATTEEAWQTGHSAERRTYLIFKDTITGGNVYSGLLIPVSVQVLGRANPVTPVINFIKDNIIVVILGIVIIILLVLLIPRMRARRAGRNVDS
jgi:hypothetical protein